MSLLRKRTGEEKSTTMLLSAKVSRRRALLAVKNAAFNSSGTSLSGRVWKSGGRGMVTDSEFVWLPGWAAVRAAQQVVARVSKYSLNILQSKVYKDVRRRGVVGNYKQCGVGKV